MNFRNILKDASFGSFFKLYPAGFDLTTSKSAGADDTTPPGAFGNSLALLLKNFGKNFLRTKAFYYASCIQDFLGRTTAYVCI
jgi:hypothetical protein